MVIYGEACWASIKTPNTKYEPKYTINLYPEAVEDLEALRGEGFTVKADKDGREYLVFSRKVSKKDGSLNKVPKLKDMNKNDIDVQVGNGSKVNVQYKKWFFNYKGDPFQGLDLQGVQVTELVEFQAADGEEFEDYDPESEF